jgi:murein DD-endopeptidase MepM/ murein hydrolase activator NlpD
MSDGPNHTHIATSLLLVASLATVAAVVALALPRPMNIYALTDRNQSLGERLPSDGLRLFPEGITSATPATPISAPEVFAEQAPPDSRPARADVSPARHESSRTCTSSELERLLASTGLDIKRLLRVVEKSSAAEGGPYIALPDSRAAVLDDQRLAELKQIAKSLPLAEPLGRHTIGSGYGARTDPFNHQPAFHPGIDMDAPYRSTVYSTGPGTVIFTGNRDSYGRVVEIDHGHGIVTWYAHLHRVLVAKGQEVSLHTAIAELGSSGRSTGPHLHYEIRINDAVVDPAKFIHLGKKLVQVGSQQ